MRCLPQTEGANLGRLETQVTFHRTYRVFQKIHFGNYLKAPRQPE